MERLAASLAAFDVYLSTSLFEGLSVAALEARAAGLPLVLSAAGGQEELAGPNLTLLPPPFEAGTLFTPANQIDRHLLRFELREGGQAIEAAYPVNLTAARHLEADRQGFDQLTGWLDANRGTFDLIGRERIDYTILDQTRRPIRESAYAERVPQVRENIGNVLTSPIPDMAAWIRAYDPTRLIHYESGRPGPEVSDVYSVMYPNLDMMKQVLADVNEKRPLIMCEYAYAKGNSTGNFFKFWDMVDAFPRFQGGCIWDWNDKALLATNEKGQKYWAYGGDFGGDFNYHQFNEDPQMCCNGIVGPDLTPAEVDLVQIAPGVYEAPLGEIESGAYGVRIRQTRPGDTPLGRTVVMSRLRRARTEHDDLDADEEPTADTSHRRSPVWATS